MVDRDALSKRWNKIILSAKTTWTRIQTRPLRSIQLRGSDTVPRCWRKPWSPTRQCDTCPQTLTYPTQSDPEILNSCTTISLRWSHSAKCLFINNLNTETKWETQYYLVPFTEMLFKWHSILDFSEEMVPVRQKCVLVLRHQKHCDSSNWNWSVRA